MFLIQKLIMFVFLAFFSLISLSFLNFNFSEAQQHQSQLQESFTRTKSVRIHLPYDIFSPKGRKDWRKQRATYSQSLIQSESSMDYSTLSKAQDYEDIWLYENWFYGMENGIIMESGALDGITYSTSYFFENYLKWTSIHIGTIFLNHLLTIL